MGGRRRRLHQGAVLEAGHGRGRDRRSAGSARTPPCATCRGRCGAASDADEAVRASTGRTGSAWPNAPDTSKAGKRSSARLYGKTVTKTYKTFLATYRAGGRGDSRGARQRRARLVSLLLHRSDGHGRGDPRSLRRPGHDRAGLPRREGSLGRGPAASAQHLDQRGRLSSEPLDAYAGGTLGLEPSSRGTLRSQRLALGRPRTPSFARRSSQSLTASHPAKRIISGHRRLVVAAKNPPVWPDASWRWPPDVVHQFRKCRKKPTLGELQGPRPLTNTIPPVRPVLIFSPFDSQSGHEEGRVGIALRRVQPPWNARSRPWLLLGSFPAVRP